MTEPVLELDGARVSFFLRAGEVNVIPGLSFTIGRGEAFGLVGESGSGKSTVALAIMRYLGRAGRLTGGRILFQGRDMAALDSAALRAVRGRQIAMVYQDPMSSLNPVMSVGRQLMEVPILHSGARPGRSAPPRARHHGGRRAAGPRAAVRPLPAPDLRRPAAAHRHRHGADRPTGPADHGRADDRPRRHGRGGDPRPGARPARPARHRAAVHQPQSRHRGANLRPRRRHVWRRAGRAGRRPPGLRLPCPSLRARPARLPADARQRQARRQAAADRRPALLAGGAHAGLRLRAALRLGAAGPLHHRRDPGNRDRGRPRREMRARQRAAALEPATGRRPGWPPRPPSRC